MRALDRGERPPDKRESRPAKAVPPNSAAETEQQEHKRRHRKSLYRRYPTCALLVKRTILRCGGTVRR